MPKPSFFQEFNDNPAAREIILEITRKWEALGFDVNNPGEKCLLFALAARMLSRNFSPKPLPNTEDFGNLSQWVDFWTSIGVELPILQASLPEILSIPLPPQSENISGNTGQKGDIFQELYQQLFLHSQRFARGEFFTPQALANKIVGEICLLQETSIIPRIIDPACGTGVFLVACYCIILESSLSDPEKISAFKQIAGFDINPFSAELTRVNLLLILAGTPFWRDPSFIQVRVQNTLEELLAASSRNQEQFDVILGNPPWGSLARLPDPALRDQMVVAAKRLEIQAPIQANNELAVIFMDLCVEVLLRSGGNVAMVLPRTILESSSLDKWRVLRSYRDIFIWVIDESVFPIPGVVFFARKGTLLGDNSDNYRIPVSRAKWNLEEPVGSLLELTPPEHWVPYHVDWDKANKLIHRVRKWVPEDSFNTAAVQRSEYYAQAEKGANIGPITFVSVIPKSPAQDAVVEFAPDLEGGKVPFESAPYSEASVEACYIFPYVKSRHLIPFGITKILHCFLPVQVVGDHFEFDRHLAPHAARHWDFLATKYAALRSLPPGKDLFSHYLNHKHHLESPKMLARFKVVFNEGGQRVKAAILREGEIVEHTLVFVPVASEVEAFYLAGIMNSAYISDFFTGAGGRGSARHVSLRPLEFPIPILDVGNPTFGTIQQDIVDAARSLEEYVKELVDNSAASVPPSTIEKKTRSYFPAAWERLNAAVTHLFKE